MLAVQTIAPYEAKNLDRPIPVPGKGQVRVRMQSVGICASDGQIWHGKHKYVKFPLVQGHEGVGVVEETGEGVTSLKPGDRVNVQQQLACGTCQSCRRGRHNVCTNSKLIGIHVDGLFAERFVCPEWNAIKTPDDFPPEKGMLAEPASVGVNSAQVAGIKPGERVVVIGAGIIGNFTAQACRAMGAADVMIADIAAPKLEIARRNGIARCVNTREADLAEEVGKAWGGDLPEAVFDCAGAEATLKQAISLTAPACRTVIVANFKEPITLEIPTFQRREVALATVMGTVRESTVKAVEYLYDGKMTVEGIVSARYPLNRMKEAYQYIDDNPATVMKVAIDC